MAAHLNRAPAGKSDRASASSTGAGGKSAARASGGKATVSFTSARFQRAVKEQERRQREADMRAMMDGSSEDEDYYFSEDEDEDEDGDGGEDSDE